ncbi:hypothetical protein GCM10009819_08800 [Agromyces tropicus]|uniref:TadE family protein n=1 Tax=Agromyces tropicus TaxID=555371 RepID=A0ABN2U4D1_9MICO
MPPSRPSAEPRRPQLRDGGGERGSASLEFLTVGVILLVPLVYLVLAIGSVQAAALGVEGAARQAARIAVLDGGGASGSVERSVRVTLADYGVEAAATAVRVDCAPACAVPGARVTVHVEADVGLPLVPALLSSSGIGMIRVGAEATQTVSRFAVST